MPPGKSWLSFLPGYENAQHGAEAMHGWGFGSHVVIQHVAAAVLVTLFIAVLGLIARGQMNKAGDDILPDDRFSARMIVELVMKLVLYIMEFTMPYKTALKHMPVLGTLGFFILFSNLLGLVPGFLPPTENLNTTFACAAIVFVYYNGYAIARMGFGHIAHMANPVGEPWGWFLAPLFLPIEIVSHCIRPVSLSVRLLCNIAGDHLIVAVFVGMFPLLLPFPFIGLGLFVAFIQTFVFLLLSSVYVGEVEANIAHHEHAHAHAEGHAHDEDHAAGGQEASAH